MPKASYTDNTSADRPPGGKHHKVEQDQADDLPTEQGGEASKKTAVSQRRVAKAEK
jgi:hypothetical protein